MRVDQKRKNLRMLKFRNWLTIHTILYYPFPLKVKYKDNLGFNEFTDHAKPLILEMQQFHAKKNASNRRTKMDPSITQLSSFP